VSFGETRGVHVQAPLGRFLEISLHTPGIQESLEFYESLGFVQAPVGETWTHAYAVVTDGRLFLGLHATLAATPTLTFVLPQLERSVQRLKDMGVSFDSESFGDDTFNAATFRDPGGLTVQLLEARTFSPPPLDGLVTSACGYFTELGMPVRELAAIRTFWEAIGFVALDEQAEPFPRTTLTSELLNVAAYRSRALRHPVLTFEDRDMRERLARLKERGHSVSDEMPDALDATTNGVLIAPEGTRLLLLQSED
jgi:hypothetical protein